MIRFMSPPHSHERLKINMLVPQLFQKFREEILFYLTLNPALALSNAIMLIKSEVLILRGLYLQPPPTRSLFDLKGFLSETPSPDETNFSFNVRRHDNFTVIHGVIDVCLRRITRLPRTMAAFPSLESLSKP